MADKPPRIGIKLLVIDDAQSDASLYGWYISKVKKYQVAIDYADNGKKGLEKMQRGEYDMVLCDYRMPTMDGPTLVTEMVKRGFNIPIVLIAGQTDEAMAANALKLGAQEFLKKRELPKLDFQSVLDRAVARRHAQMGPAEIAEYERLRGELFSQLSRELRSTLEGMSKLEQGMPAGGRPAAPDLATTFQGMKQSAVQMEAVIEDLNNLKNFLQPTPVNPKTISLKGLLDAGLARKRPLLDTLGIHVEYQFPTRDVKVRADPESIQVVLENLLSNAVQYTPNDGKIAVSAERFSSGWVRVGVRNSGQGISPGAYARILGTPQPLPGDAGMGLGLGLKICKKIIEAHGGRLWLETDPQGALAYLTLPAASKA